MKHYRLDVFKCGPGGQQVEVLEDEADLVLSQRRPFRVGQLIEGALGRMYCPKWVLQGQPAGNRRNLLRPPAERIRLGTV